MSIILLNSEISEPDGTVLVTPSTAVILAAYLPNGQVEDKFAAIAAQPSTFCATGFALAMVVTDGGATTTSSRVRVVGTDAHGRALDEEKFTNAAGSASYSLAKPFHTITALDVQGVGFAGADRIAIVATGILGLPAVIDATGDVLVARVDAAIEAAPTVSVADNTWTPASAPNGARRFYLNVRGE